MRKLLGDSRAAPTTCQPDICTNIHMVKCAATRHLDCIMRAEDMRAAIWCQLSAVPHLTLGSYHIQLWYKHGST